MTDAEALKIADKPDWWMGPDGRGEVMRSLREALQAMAAFPGRAFLFRPGGRGVPAVWLSAEDIVRLDKVMARQAHQAA